MEKPKRVLCIMDMAGVGRSSMAVVLPVLAACGVQACPLTTALFSTHMGGFGSATVEETAIYAKNALAHYIEKGIEFDAVYTGYLQGALQFAIAKEAQQLYPNALKICDPAMGDHGKLYGSITDDMVGDMRIICKNADLITPNYTELALLLGHTPIVEEIQMNTLHKNIGELLQGKGSAVVTSVPIGQNGLQIVGYDKNDEKFYTKPVKLVPQNYPGTGDLFTAALVGLLLRGVALRQATLVAGEFVEASVAQTFLAKGAVREGVWFESQLYKLVGYVNNL